MGSATKALGEGAEKGIITALSSGATKGSLEGLMRMMSGEGVTPTAASQISRQFAESGGIAGLGKHPFTAVYETPGGGLASYGVDQGGGPGGAGGGRGGGGGGSIWEGGFGAMLYGGYIAKRFWGYTGQPVMQATEEYAAAQAQLGPMMTGEIQGGGGAATLTSRRGAAKYALGGAGYDLMGPLMAGSSSFVANPYGADIAATAGIFGGAAIGAKVMGASFGKFMGSSSFGVPQQLAPYLGEAITGKQLGQLGGSLARGIGAAGVVYGGLALGANVASDITGKEYTAWSALESMAQTFARGTGAAGMYAGRGVAGALGLEEQYGSAVEWAMGETAGGRWLQKDIGATGGPGGELATRGELTEAMTDLNLGKAEQVVPYLGAAYQATGQRGIGGANAAWMTAQRKMVATEAMSEAGAASAMGGYAESLGYLPGQAGYAGTGISYAGMTIEERSTATRGAARRAGMAGMARQYVSTEQIGEVALRSMMGGYATQQQAQIGIQSAGQLTAVGVDALQAQQAGVTLMQGAQGGQYSLNQAQWAAQTTASVLSPFSMDTLRAAGLAEPAPGTPGTPATTAHRIPTFDSSQMGQDLRRATGLSGISTGGAWAGRAGELPVAARTQSNLEVLEQGFASLAPNQQFAVNAVAAGDIQGMSIAARAGDLGTWAAFNNQYGAPMYTTDIGAAMDQARAFDIEKGTSISGLAGVQGWGTGATATASGKFQAMLNTTGYGMNISAGAASAMDQGYRGLTGMNAVNLRASDIQFGAQMAQGGIQLKGIEAKQQMLWGGGSWDRPAAGSVWALEDQQRGIQWGSTQQDWEAQRQRTQMGTQFAVAGESLQQQRMTASRGYQQYQFGYERSGQLLQREWTQQDNQYEDTMRGLQTSWGMEDINEQIRFSTGRQRRNLVKQRGRMVTQTNLEEEQVDRTRDREQQIWAREDEQFQKRVEYFEKTSELEDKQFELQISRREQTTAFETKEFERHVQEQIELHKINEEMIKINRKNQAEDMERQKESIKIGMAAAAAQKEANDLNAKASQLYTDMGNSLKVISEQKRAIETIKAMVALVIAVNGTDPNKVKKLMDLFALDVFD
jgi:hypothetical protein